MEQQERFAGVRLPDPGFAGDDGSADPALAGALAEHAAGALSSHDVVAALAGARLLVPVVAVLDEAEVGADGLRRDKDSHMATVSLLNPDGRRGLLAFTSTATLAAWQSDARPVAATSQRVAQAALQEGADAVLLDVAGPVRFPVEGARAAGAGRRHRLAGPAPRPAGGTPPYGPWRASPCSPCATAPSTAATCWSCSVAPQRWRTRSGDARGPARGRPGAAAALPARHRRRARSGAGRRLTVPLPLRPPGTFVPPGVSPGRRSHVPP